MKRMLQFLLGCAAGATVALLTTPKSGRELREQLLTAPRQRLLAHGEQNRPADEVAPEWSSPGAATAPARPAAYAQPAPAGAEETPARDDLGLRIAETRMALEAEIARTFASVAATARDAGPTAEEEPPVTEAPTAEEEPVAEEAPVAPETPAYETTAEVEAAPVPAAISQDETPAVELPHMLAANTIAEEVLVAPEPLPEETPAALDAEIGAPEPTDEVAPPAELVAIVGPDSVVEPAPATAPIVEPATIAESVTVIEPATVVEPESYAEPVPETETAPAAETDAEPEPSAKPDDGVIDQAEMRRRIEETRARLKAKAFDAMMSGESALLGRERGDKPGSYGAEVEVDKEVADTIDESLSQEEF